jgi:hypothetical protein
MNEHVNNVPVIGKNVAVKSPSQKREIFVRLPRATQEIVTVEPIGATECFNKDFVDAFVSRDNF